MQIDFHYYMAYALAKEAGLDGKACNVIAHASQFADDNTDRKYGVDYRNFEFLIPFPDRIEDRGKRFHPIITQAVNLEAKEIETQKYVYAAFHFLPVGNVGNENKYSIKNQKNPYCTIANSRNAAGLFSEAVGSGDPYRIGIAMHTYVDTFSHERFTAFEEDWNKVRGGLLPPIGHAKILHEPDVISHEWKDKRFHKGEVVDNRARAMDASKAAFKLLNPSGDWNRVKTKFRKIIDSANSKDRIELIRNEYPQCPEYDRDTWFTEALKIEVNADEVPFQDDPLIPWRPKEPRFYKIRFRDDFEKSHWYKFQMAAKGQLAWVLQKINIL